MGVHERCSSIVFQCNGWDAGYRIYLNQTIGINIQVATVHSYKLHHVIDCIEAKIFDYPRNIFLKSMGGDGTSDKFHCDWLRIIEVIDKDIVDDIRVEVSSQEYDIFYFIDFYEVENLLTFGGIALPSVIRAEVNLLNRDLIDYELIFCDGV